MQVLCERFESFSASYESLIKFHDVCSRFSSESFVEYAPCLFRGFCTAKHNHNILIHEGENGMMYELIFLCPILIVIMYLGWVPSTKLNRS